MARGAATARRREVVLASAVFHKENLIVPGQNGAKSLMKPLLGSERLIEQLLVLINTGHGLDDCVGIQPRDGVFGGIIAHAAAGQGDRQLFIAANVQEIMRFSERRQGWIAA